MNSYILNYDWFFVCLKNQQEGNITKGIVNRIKRENRCIPDLIFQIEDCEKYLIQLSKITNLNLLRYAKRSTSRDFKIAELNNDTLEESNQNEEEECDHSNASKSESAKDLESDQNEEEDCDHSNATKSGSAKDPESDVEETDTVQLPEEMSMVAEDTEDEHEDEDEDALPRVKRSRTGAVVQDSSDEEV